MNLTEIYLIAIVVVMIAAEIALFLLIWKGTEMEQTRKMLTITELIEKGWSRELLMRIAHMPSSPMFRTSPRGKFFVMEDKLEEFCSARRIGK